MPVPGKPSGRFPRTWSPASRATSLSSTNASGTPASGGRNRLQWSTCYVLDPATVEEEQAVSAYLASQFVADLRLDYGPRHYPYYGDPFRSPCPPRWSEQLDRLGALAAAEAEQRQMSSEASSDHHRGVTSG